MWGPYMKKTLLIALVLLGLTIIVILFNAGESVQLNLPGIVFKMKSAMAYFIFLAVGVVVGVLLK